MKINPAILAIYVSMSALHAQSLFVNPGDPLPGLSAEDLQLFQSGRTDFATPPRFFFSFNTCNGCHAQETTLALGGGWGTTPPLFGAGLIESIPDEAILALQKQTEGLALGIAGR